jgi:hypothetical protein
VHDDEQAIVDLTIAYTWALDTRHYDDLRAVFAPDATAFLGAVHCDGVDAIIARVDRALTRLDASQHIVSNHQVHVDGDRATCRCYFQAQHLLRGTPGGDTFIVAGTYEDAVARRPEGWRIVDRTLTTVWEFGNSAVLGRPT